MLLKEEKKKKKNTVLLSLNVSLFSKKKINKSITNLSSLTFSLFRWMNTVPKSFPQMGSFKGELLEMGRKMRSALLYLS